MARIHRLTGEELEEFELQRLRHRGRKIFDMGQTLHRDELYPMTQLLAVSKGRYAGGRVLTEALKADGGIGPRVRALYSMPSRRTFSESGPQQRSDQYPIDLAAQHVDFAAFVDRNLWNSGAYDRVDLDEADFLEHANIPFAERPLPPLRDPELPEPLDEYEEQVAIERENVRLAQKLGQTSPALGNVVRRAIVDAFRKYAILVYPYDSVKSYMDAIVANENARRGRRPGPLTATESRAFFEGGRSWVRWEWNPLSMYDRPVPNTILAKATAVVDILKTELADLGITHAPCEVTHYVVERPDPFLCIHVAPCPDRFVIAHWDEPGYRISGDHVVPDGINQ